MDKTIVNFQRYFTQETDINLGYVNFSSVPVTLYIGLFQHFVTVGLYKNYFDS